ncbi:hypothetical protein [Acidiphilium sp.]|uniref:phage scaffolding protein n=1 Tax=Acidiphilium sp. TaxID=527 RepID=UPI002BC138A1|nr:hypothetical protein [Acidiphilium sp.]HQT62553.1 hypothetical protein [Acidiphilium sp.]
MPPTEEEFQAQIAALTAERDGLKGRLSEVNNEAKGHRLNADNFRTQAEKAAADAEQARKDAEAKIADANKRAEETLTKAQQKAVTADLKIAAREAGAVDIADILALVDRTKLKVNADGDVENAAELLAEMKAAKPHLFAIKSTSSTGKQPPPDTKPKHARDMTDAEFDAVLKSSGIRLG